MPTLSEIKARFSGDRFATEALGAEILEAEQGHARCSVQLRPEHMNVNHVPMGGAIFTLADFAFAIAANAFETKQGRTTVSQHISITFLSPAKGNTLIAEAKVLKSGHSTCLYQVDVHDETGVYVAFATVNGFSVG